MTRIPAITEGMIRDYIIYERDVSLLSIKSKLGDKFGIISRFSGNFISFFPGWKNLLHSSSYVDVQLELWTKLRSGMKANECFLCQAISKVGWNATIIFMILNECWSKGSEEGFSFPKIRNQRNKLLHFNIPKYFEEWLENEMYLIHPRRPQNTPQPTAQITESFYEIS